MAISGIFDQLMRDEGLRLKPYKDSMGKLTIGYGRNLDDGGIGQDEAEFLMHNDVTKVDASLQKYLPWSKNLDRVRYGVLQNMCFNMGIGCLMTFKTFLGLMQAGKYCEAANDLETSLWHREVGPRAVRLEMQLRSGEWV